MFLESEIMVINRCGNALRTRRANEMKTCWVIGSKDEKLDIQSGEKLVLHDF